MKNTKKMISLAIVFCMVLTCSVVPFVQSSAAIPPTYKSGFELYGNALVSMDLLAGTGNASDPLGMDNDVTREQAITMILSFMNESAAANALTEADIAGALEKYPDNTAVSTWARKFVAYATIKGYVGGRTDGTYDPKGNVKGYEFGIMLFNSMAYKPGQDYEASFALKNLEANEGFALLEKEKAYIVGINAGILSRGECMAVMYGALGITRKDTEITQIKTLINANRITQEIADTYFYKLERPTAAIDYSNYEYYYDDFENGNQEYFVWYLQDEGETGYGHGTAEIDNTVALTGSSSIKYVGNEDYDGTQCYLLITNTEVLPSEEISKDFAYGFYLYIDENSNLDYIKLVAQDSEWSDDVLITVEDFVKGGWVYVETPVISSMSASSSFVRLKIQGYAKEVAEPVTFWIDNLWIGPAGTNPFEDVTEGLVSESGADLVIPAWTVNTAIGGAAGLPAFVTDGSATNVTPELKEALGKAKFVEPKNYILMIGDGMGLTHVAASEQYLGELIMTQLPNKGESMTLTTDGVTTDSSAGGTALATGYKTKYGYIGLDKDKNEVKNLSELARELGKTVGVITNGHVGDATPADFTVHNISRDNQEQIYKDEFMWAPDLLMGTGDWYMQPLFANSEYASHIKENGMAYCATWSRTLKSDASKIFGIYSAAMGYENTNPTDPNMCELTAFTLSWLQAHVGDEGFFVMIEDGETDAYGHSNNLEGTINEVQNFDESIAIALKFVLENPDTVLIVTADHETGGLTLNDGWENDKSLAAYTKSGHSEQNVPIYAIGYGTEELNGKVVENEVIGQFLGALMGDASFGNVK